MSEEQAAEAAENTNVDEQFAAADAAADPVDPPSVEDIASELGWMPKEKFRGDEGKWKPADQFIRDGKSIQERQSRELKEIRTTLDTVARTSGQILADKLAQQHAELSARYAKAVDDGDHDTAWRAANAILGVQQQAAAATAAPRASPAPETEQWVSKNSRVMRDPVAAKYALQICDQYARANYSVPDQLANTELMVRREFPHLFDDKPAPQVNGSMNRNSAGAPRGQAFADLPQEAKKIALDIEDRLGVSKDQYAKNYFAAQQRKA